MFQRRRIIPLAAVFAALALLAPSGVLSQTARPGQALVRSDSLQIGGSAVSADGRWIVFAARPDWGQSNLFVVPAQGGEAVQLTRGRFSDHRPVWAPDGRSVVFRSDRVAGAGVFPGHLMRVPFDPETGRAAGIPRPVSMVPVMGASAVSPDGTHVVFHGNMAGAGAPEWSVVVVPLEGGRARVLSERSSSLLILNSPLGWDATGEHVYFARSRPDGTGHLLYRTGLDDEGEAALPELSPAGMLLLRIDGDRFLWGKGEFPACRPAAIGTCSNFLVVDAEGREVGHIPGGTSPTPFPNGKGFLRAEVEQVAELVVAPLAGGEASVIRDPGEEVDLLGWTQAGDLFFSIESAGKTAYFLWNPASGQRTRVMLPDASSAIKPRIHPEGRYVVHSTARDGEERANLVIHDLETGDDRIVSTQLASRIRSWGSRVLGRGGHPSVDEGRFVFMEAGPDQTLVVRAVTPDGPVETLAEVTSGLTAVHGARVAWVTRVGDGYELRLFDGESGTARTLVRSDVALGPLLFWSNDGRTIAMLYPGSGAGLPGYDLAFLRLDDPDQTLVVKETEWKYLNGPLHWTPDDALLVMAANGASSGAYTDVWIVDSASDAPSVPVVSDPNVWLGGSEVSPDGRHVAYNLWRTTGSALVRYEMDPPRSGAGGRSIRR